MNIERLGSTLGVAVHGVQAAGEPGDELIATLRQLASQAGLVVLRDQQLTPQQHVDFTRRFGEPERLSPHDASAPPEIFRLSNRGDGYDVGHYWHADGAQKPRPTALSTLYAIEVPQAQPTHTRFLSASAAYAALPRALANAVEGRRMLLPSKVKAPILRAHPSTGDPLLFLPIRFPSTAAPSRLGLALAIRHLNANALPTIEGLSPQESEQTLLQLVEHAISDATWQQAHTWQPRDLVIWDQARVYHHAESSPARRVLHRTSVKGQPAAPYEGLGMASAHGARA